MAFSIIQPRIGNCNHCPAINTIVTKVGKDDYYCINCNRNRKNKKQLQKIREKQSIRSLGKTEMNREVKEENDLSSWFAGRMEYFLPICENCGAEKISLMKPEFKKQWKSCQSHLLPKRHFRSIATHPLNGMVLGTGYSGLCNCHDTYDSSWSAASEMKIWPEVIRRVKVMLPLIHKSELKYMPDAITKELEKLETI